MAVVAQVVLKPVELFMVYWFSEETVTAEHLPDGTVLERNIDTFGRNAGFELTAGGSRVVATEYAYSIKGRGNCKITLVSEENG